MPPTAVTAETLDRCLHDFGWAEKQKLEDWGVTPAEYAARVLALVRSTLAD